MVFAGTTRSLGEVVADRRGSQRQQGVSEQVQSPHGPRTPRITAATRLVSGPWRHTPTDTAAGHQRESRALWYKEEEWSFPSHKVYHYGRGEGVSPDVPLVARARCVAPFAWAAYLWMTPTKPTTNTMDRNWTHTKRK